MDTHSFGSLLHSLGLGTHSHIEGPSPLEAYCLVHWKSSQSFIHTLASGQKAFGKQDRLHPLLPDTTCLLCNIQLETHDHLFFECPYSQQLWHNISLRGSFFTPTIPWDLLIPWLSTNWKGNSLQMKTNLLCLSLTVYYLWRERNNRFHVHTSTSVPDLGSLIVQDVRLKLSTYRRVWDTSQNRAIQVDWRLPDSIFSNL